MNIDDGFDSFKGFFKKDFTYLFLDRGEKREKERRRERERETSMCGCLSCAPHTPRDLVCNLGMCPDWESKL